MSPSVSVRLLLTQSDARLVELARAGHERAFEAIVQRYRRPLLGYCRRLLLPHERAEDALQQGLLQAWLALRNGAEVRDVKPWLYRVVHNTALNMLRSSGYDYATLSEALSGAGAPSEDLDRRIAVREALAGLAALPDKQREALLRTAVDGSSYQQAAATMGLSESALRGLVHRARATLRTAATALTPSPLLSWALSAGGGDASLGARLAEAGAGGGSIGIGGLLVKTSATVVTAGVLVGGIGTLHHPQRSRHAGARQRSVLAAGTGAGARESDREGAEGELASNQGHLGGSAALNPPGATHAAPHRFAAYVVPHAGTPLHRHAGGRRPLRTIPTTITPSHPLVPASQPTGTLAPATRPIAPATHMFRHDGGGDRSGAGSSDPHEGSGGEGGASHDGNSRDGGASHDGNSRDGGGGGGASEGDASAPAQGSGSASPDGHGREPSGGSDGGGETHGDGSGPSDAGSGESGAAGQAGSGATGSGGGGSN